MTLDVEASGAKRGYILDRTGTVVVSSDRGNAAPSEARNYGFAPYFQASIAGEAGYHFAFDAASGTRDYYASYPIRDEAGKIVGVAVLQMSLDRFEADLKQFDRAYLFIDPHGVVVVTNRPNMLLRPLWPLSTDMQLTLSRQYGTLNGLPILDREVTGATWVSGDGERDYVQRRYAAHSDWSLVIVMTPRGIFASRVLGIVITLLTATATLVYLVGRERWVHDSVQLAKRLELEELARNLDQRATTDSLTGLFNRLKFDRDLSREMARSLRYHTPLSLILYDIDHFKRVNDTYGHQAGDKVLVQLSRFVADRTRKSDVLARCGGEEFVILVPETTGAMAYRLAQNLREAIGEAAFEAAGTVTCSFGIAQFHSGDSAETFISRADDALYRAKINGRNRVELALQPGVAKPDRDSIKSDMISAA